MEEVAIGSSELVFILWLEIRVQPFLVKGQLLELEVIPA